MRRIGTDQKYAAGQYSVSYGASISETLHSQSANLDKYLIVSSIDLELMRPNSALSKSDIKKMLRAVPRLESIVAAFEDGGVDGLNSLAMESATVPQSVWWCHSRMEFESEIDGIYDRLASSRRPHDAYDCGVMGTVGWVYMWVDW
jgi:hypothetical protein